MRASFVGGIIAAGMFASQQAASAPASVEVIAAKDPGRVLCAYLYHEGSVIRPVCHTAQYWANERNRTRRELLEWQLRKLTYGMR